MTATSTIIIYIMFLVLFGIGFCGYLLGKTAMKKAKSVKDSTVIIKIEKQEHGTNN